MNIQNLENLAKLVRYFILTMSTKAGSGHPTSSLSATDLLTTLWFDGFFHFDFEHPDDPNNDRMIFSKGHASPLFYALYAVAGAIDVKELDTYRQFDSRLEGHPTPRFPFTEAATGSLGQGLSMGVGQALALRAQAQSSKIKDQKKETNKGLLRTTNYELPTVFVLLGDGEIAEGSVWEAVNLASYYQLDNLVAIVDVNRLGQTQETMLGWDTDRYQKRFEAFGWDTVVVDGHNFKRMSEAFESQKSKVKSQKQGDRKKPFAIIAKTVKGKGISFLENKDGWHGKPVPREQLEAALKELGKVDVTIRGTVAKPVSRITNQKSSKKETTNYELRTTYSIGDSVATRKAYGTALAKLGALDPNIVVLDAETKNSTYAEDFKKVFPDRYYEMFIAEQNMVGVAVGFSKRGYKPFISTFACFLTRAFDQFRMASLSGSNISVCGSHAGVSIGEDGPSQMGLEDIAMFRAINGSTVLYPSDAVSTEKLVSHMTGLLGVSYIRTSRPPTPVIYDNAEEFPIGGFKIHTLSSRAIPLSSRAKGSHDFPQSRDLPPMKKKITIISAGVTLFEALKAQEELAKEGIEATVIDLYSIKPLDGEKLRKTIYHLGCHCDPVSLEVPTSVGIPIDIGTIPSKQKSDADCTCKTGENNTPIQIVTVEDHWSEGGLGDAVLGVFASVKNVLIHKLAVTKTPRSGKPAQLLDYEGISAPKIVEKVKSILG